MHRRASTHALAHNLAATRLGNQDILLRPMQAQNSSPVPLELSFRMSHRGQPPPKTGGLPFRKRRFSPPTQAQRPLIPYHSSAFIARHMTTHERAVLSRRLSLCELSRHRSLRFSIPASLDTIGKLIGKNGLPPSLPTGQRPMSFRVRTH